MDAYQSEIFTFLTKRDNFDSLIKLMSHYDNVRAEILNRFWKAVETHLRQMVKDPAWEIRLDANIFTRYSKLQMYKPNWKYESRPLLSITWEGLSGQSYRGLLVYTEMEPKGFDLTSIRTLARNFCPDNYSWLASQSWAWWFNSPINFNNPKDLAEILPEKCDEVAKAWATELYELALNHEKQIDEIALKIWANVNPSST